MVKRTPPWWYAINYFDVLIYTVECFTIIALCLYIQTKNDVTILIFLKVTCDIIYKSNVKKNLKLWILVSENIPKLISFSD